ncbi:sickle tail protein homolog isoform X4 [Pseudoliparis swirei]|uniref:sickle tail protein homolog isoform X4 n=1 Tax=Pseudoliparis swirei TaxID=2059687 RepID=UPI0024BDD57E|nr:sickle tail protein homolog isoform X4 [Pseudoliparis swirei]
MSKASRLARPPSIGARSKLPPSRKECHGTVGRVRVLSVGEKLMRAGSDGILSRQKSLKAAAPPDKAQSETQTETQAPSQGPDEKGQLMEMVAPKSRICPPKVASQPQGSVQKQSKSNLKVTSSEDAQHVSRRQASPNGTAPSKGDAKGSRTVPRRHTLGGARGSREILAMQPPDMDKKREAFLEHLKQKYPHHASAIMGHQERLREQSRSPKHGPHSSAGDQVDHLSLASLDSLDAMSEADSPTAFTRGSRIRASLPVVRSTNQTKDRSLGVLYLQYGDETKQICMPNEITSIDTIRALFVSAFSQQLNMKMLESPSVAVYVKDDMRNMYYELTDVRNIIDHSCLKVYHKDPAQAFSHGPRPANGDARQMHGEMIHAVQGGPHPLRQPPMGPPSHHPMQGALPPTPNSMPPSPSRIPFGPRQASIPGNGTIPRDRLSSANPPARSISPCPSAILERRDVKPDEDRSTKSHTLSRGSEGLYADPYLLQEGRMSIASSHGPNPSPGLDGPDHGMGSFHRASIRSTSSYSGPSPTDTMDHPSLYRQKSRNSQLPTLGSKTPPPSPHRMAEVRMIDIHGGPPHGGPLHGGPPHGGPPHGGPPHGGPPHGGPPHGGSPHGGPPHGGPPHGGPPHGGPPHGGPPRGGSPHGGSPYGGPPHGGPPHGGPPHGGPPHGGPPRGGSPHGGPPHGVPPHGVPMERSSPVRQSFRKEEVAGTKPQSNMASPVVPDLQGPIPVVGEHHTRERTSSKTSSPAHSAHSSGGSPVLAPKSSAAPLDKSPVPLKVNLLQFRKNVSDLRMQLHQMRQQQVQNQEALRVQLKRAEQEISVKLAEAMRGLEDPVQRQRALVEEDRHKYLGLEERVLTQIGELEQYVGSLQKDSAVTHRGVTLKDVEEGALTLRKVGESLAGLKGEFPSLQTRMRSVLRVEVEAVKFLKEEPHKLDSMLKRVKSLTDTLSSMRRCATEGPQKGPEPSANVPVDNSSSAAEAPAPSVQPGSTSAPPEPQSSTIKSEVMPSSPVVIHHVQSSPVHIQQSQKSAALTAQPSPPLSPSPSHIPSPTLGKSQGPDSPKGAASDPPSPAHHKKTQGNPVNNGNGTVPQVVVKEELQNSQDKNQSRAMSIKAAEREWEERRQNMGHYDGKEFEKILQEAQANMMKGIPSLEVEENPSLTPDATAEQAAIHNPVESPTEPQSEPQSDKPAKKGPEKLPKPVMEKPSKPALERPPKTATKPAPPDSSTKQGSEKSSKSPPPPPPRKTYSSSSSGMTTTRSGEVVFTGRKESVSPQEGEEDTPPPSPQPKPIKVPPETKPKPATPPPVTLVDTREEEDEGEKIMAELQVFQRCTVKDVGVKNVREPTSRIEPQIRELRPEALLPLKEKKQSSEPTRDDKDPDTDENGNTTVRQSQGVIYYVTGQIPKEHPPPSGTTEETPEHTEPSQSPTQVSNVNVNDNSPSQQQQQQPQSPPPTSPTPRTPPPISPKPVGLKGFKLPRTQVKRSESLKTSTEMEKGKILNKINTEKKSIVIQEKVSSSKNIITKLAATTTTTTSTVREAPKFSVALPKKAQNVDSHPPKFQSNHEECNEEASLSPDLPGEEAPPPPDNIAFMITSTKVQALSCGEYQDLVNAKKGSVQTVTIGNATSRGRGTADPFAPEDIGFNKKPVIIIFDEPMDIRSAYKRLSVIFEGEEELDRMLAAECIEEEDEESDTEGSGGLQGKARGTEAVDGKNVLAADHISLSSSSSSSISELTDSGGNLDSNSDAKQDGKKKFKFKFPKKQLAALSQAIRLGTKSGKKTIQVVVYEDEEESDGTIKMHKEAKRFEITRSKSLSDASKATDSIGLKRQNAESLHRTDEIRKNTYKTLDSLEQTIKQLETTISEMGPHSPGEPVCTEEAEEEDGKGSEVVGLKRSSSLPTSRGPGPKVPSKNPMLKKTKPQLLPRPVIIPTTTTTTTVPSVPTTVQQNTSVASPTSRMPVPLSAKSRQSPGTTDKAGKQQKLQDAQRQFRQANGSAKRVGGDHKTTSLTIPTSKIPAFYPSSPKGSAQSAQNPDATNPINPSSSSSSTSVIKSNILSCPAPRSGCQPSSHIPSLSNGSLKLPTTSQHTGKALSFPSQTQNGRVHSSSSFSSSSSSSSSSSPSPLSPTPLGPGGKSIRTIHTPSFTSYRSHNGSSGKSCIPTATAAKDAT